MPDFLSVNQIAFSLLDYPMSYVELFGTLFYLGSVWLIARRHMLTWPLGLISSLLYLALFYQIRLYSDALEQVYYLAAGVYGWWYWKASQQKADDIAVRYSTRRGIVGWIAVTLVLSCALGFVMSQAHRWLPSVFPAPAAYPFLDALTTVMSFVAMWLVARQRTESWFYWIVVDVIGIGLYYAKDVRLVALLYVILLAMAISGLWSWRKAHALN